MKKYLRMLGVFLLAAGCIAGWGYAETGQSATPEAAADSVPATNGWATGKNVLADEAEQPLTFTETLLSKGKRLWGDFTRKLTPKVSGTRNAVLCRHSSKLCLMPVTERKK